MELAPLQRVSVAQYDHTTDAISDREALESFHGVPASCSSLLESVGELEEAGWSWRHSKGSVSPSVTIRQLEGARRHS